MNSRLRVSNQLELAEHAAKFQSRAAELGTRALLVVISPPQGWLKSFAQFSQCEYFDAASDTDRADRISALLGTERYMAVLQLGFRPDLGLLAATAGTVKAGGLIFLGTNHRPAAYPTTTHPDNTVSVERHRHISHSQQRLERLASAAAATHPETVVCVELDKERIASIMTPAPDAPPQPADCQKTCLPAGINHDASAEQDALLIEAFSHLTNHASSCIVIKGRRGRGKSSLLARLALQLENIGREYKITALHASALSSFREHAGNTRTHYTSPESATRSSADILLVDEAANLPIKQLQHYLACFRHVVFCTTIEGYEASGRAFDVRLLSDWSSHSMALLQLHARQSWRWAKNDAVENFTDQLLLNKHLNPPALLSQWATGHAQTCAAKCQLRCVSQDDLLRDESLLASVHSLLYTTHYQTTTKDLEHLLDAHSVQLWVQLLEDVVVGVLVVEQEGEIDSGLQEPILAKARRLPNQLLPQLLAQTANIPDGLGKRYARIIRLAVTFQLRRQKLASRLLHAVTDDYLNSTSTTPSKLQKVDAIGASFAADDCSIGFWQSHGYTEFHRGFRSNPRTGKQAVAVLRSFEPVTSDILSAAAAIHNDNKLARQNSLLCSPDQSMTQTISTRDIQLLQRFAAGQRSQHDTYASLQRLCRMTGFASAPQRDQSVRQHELEMRHYVQQWIENCPSEL